MATAAFDSFSRRAIGELRLSAATWAIYSHKHPLFPYSLARFEMMLPDLFCRWHRENQPECRAEKQPRVAPGYGNEKTENRDEAKERQNIEVPRKESGRRTPTLVVVSSPDPVELFLHGVVDWCQKCYNSDSRLRLKFFSAKSPDVDNGERVLRVLE